jgi:hypothetical protein
MRDRPGRRHFYQARSGNECSQVIGFIILTIPRGTNLIADQLYQINDSVSPQNSANGWFEFLQNNSYTEFPNNAQIMQWNGQSFNTNTFVTAGPGWQSNGDNTLLPGQAEFFVNPTSSSITVPFTGLIAQGGITKVISPGINFVSSIVPEGGLIHSKLGYNPNNDDKVLFWNGTNYTTNTYSGGAWSLGEEPSLKIGEGFVLDASQSNNWVEAFSPCTPGLFVVTANPLWTDTGLHVNSNDTVIFTNVTGTWTGDGETWWGPGGNGTNSTDCFVTGPQFSLFAFVGPQPLLDGTTNEWGTTFFPQPSGTNGYWFVGTNVQFTSTRAGELWFGFNDDARTEKISDNFDSEAGETQITGP